MGFIRRVRDDLESALKRTQGSNMYIYNPSCASDLTFILSNIASRLTSNTNPLLQLDFHEHRENGCLLASGEFVSWPSLSHSLGEINLRCKNRLAVISCACFSFKLIRLERLDVPAPFNFIAAPSEEITIGSLQQRLTQFYQALIDQRDLESALKSLQPEFSFHWPEYDLFFVIRDELNKYRGNKGRKNLEEAVSSAIVSGRIQPDQIAVLRRRLRRLAQDFTEADLAKLVDEYLCGRKPFFTVEDLRTIERNPYWMR